jgi:hypothetical protein
VAALQYQPIGKSVGFEPARLMRRHAGGSSKFHFSHGGYRLASLFNSGE